MGMLGTGIDEEIAFDGVSETGFWQHAVDGLLHHRSGLEKDQLGRSHETLTAGIAGMRHVFALGPLAAGHSNLVGIDDDHIVAAVCVRGVIGFMLATEHHGSLRCETTQHLVFGIQNHPLFGGSLGISRYGFVT